MNDADLKILREILMGQSHQQLLPHLGQGSSQSRNEYQSQNRVDTNIIEIEAFIEMQICTLSFQHRNSPTHRLARLLWIIRWHIACQILCKGSSLFASKQNIEENMKRIRKHDQSLLLTKSIERGAHQMFEAWDRFKDLFRACLHHGFSELHQLDTFYNALNSKDQDSLNSADGVSMNTSTFGISPDVADLKDMVKALLRDKKNQNQAPATMKAVEESCVTCGGAHSYQNCPATDGNVYRDNIQEFVSQASSVNYNQGNTSYRLSMMSNEIRPPGFPPVPNNQNVQLNQRNNQNRFNQNQNRGKNFNQGPVYQPLVLQPPAYQAPTYPAPAPQIQVNTNSASTSSSGTLPSNTIANPRSDLKAITTQSSVSYDGPQIPPPHSFLPKVVENEPEATKDTVHPTNNESTEEVQPPVVQSESLILNSEPVNSPIIEHKLCDKANDQREKFFQIFKDLNFNISFADALILMPKFDPSIKSLLTNKDKLCELARTLLNEQCSAVLLKKLPERLGDPDKFLIPCDFLGKAECLALADLGASINLMLLSVWNKLYLPDLSPACMTLELADRLISRPVGVVEDVYVKVGELTLRVGKEAITFNLDQTSRYSANYNDMTAKRIDVIDMAYEEYSQEVLGFSDVIASGNPTPYYDPIVSTTSLTLTPFENSVFLLEEVDAFLALEDDPTSLEELKICEAKSDKSSINEPPEVELKDLPPHLEYAFLEGDDKLPVIIAKALSGGEDRSYNGSEVTQDFEPAIQYQRRVNPKIHDVIKQEVLKLLDAGLIYPISDSPWVSPVHCVPKKSGFTVVEN
nr:reverse transcriptase domain-containing protein [Tanacetum cinerariifolium]